MFATPRSFSQLTASFIALQLLKASPVDPYSLNHIFHPSLCQIATYCHNRLVNVSKTQRNLTLYSFDDVVNTYLNFFYFFSNRKITTLQKNYYRGIGWKNSSI